MGNYPGASAGDCSRKLTAQFFGLWIYSLHDFFFSALLLFADIFLYVTPLVVPDLGGGGRFLWGRGFDSF